MPRGDALMNVFRSLKCWLLAAGLGLVLAGCGSVEDPINPKAPWSPEGMTGLEPAPVERVEPVDAGPDRTTIPAPPVTATDTSRIPKPVEPTTGGPVTRGTVLRIGDLVKVTFSDITPALPIHEERIREDGNITLPLNVSVRAAGRTASELQEAIRKEYIDRGYYRYLTVTVRTDDLIFFVGGEVRTPGRQLYSPGITVTRAIDTAGGFTEYSNKKKIELIRASGSKLQLNYDKAVKNEKLDYEVYPGDRIHVPAKGVFN